MVISERLRCHSVIDADRQRYVAYIGGCAENVAMERDFSQDFSCPSQQPVCSLGRS